MKSFLLNRWSLENLKLSESCVNFELSIRLCMEKLGGKSRLGFFARDGQGSPHYPVLVSNLLTWWTCLREKVDSKQFYQFKTF